MRRFSLYLLTIIGTMTLTTAVPHHHYDEATAHFLKQLKKAKKHGRGGSVSFTGGNRDQYEPAQSASSVDPTSTPILFPSQSSGSGSGSSSSSGSNFINLPQIPQPSPASPADIQRVNSGVATILQGVRSFDLGQILRGAFIFPRNENVKSVANTVLDNIFGPLGKGDEGSGGAGSSVSTGDRSAPSFRN